MSQPRDRALVGLMALPYVVQAATGNPGLAFLPVADYLTLDLGFSAGQLAGFQAMVLLPWMIKPLWAVLIDSLTQRGYHVRGLLALCFGSLALGFSLLSWLLSPTVGWLLMGLGLLSVIVALADVVADRWMVIEGQRQRRGNVYQAAQWIGWGSTATVAMVGGGWLADHLPLHRIFGLSTVVPALALLLVLWTWPETARDPHRQEAQMTCREPLPLADHGPKPPGLWAGLRNTIQQSDLRDMLVLVVVLHLSPLPVDYLYQVQELGFDNRLVGQIKAVEYLGTALGALGFGLWA